MSKNLALMVSVLLGVLAVGLIYFYLKNKEAEATRGMEMRYVLVAAEDLPEGSKLNDENVARRDYPVKYVGDRAVTPDAAPAIIGAVVKYNIQKGKPIFWSDIILPEISDEGIAGDLEPGMNAVTLPVSPVSGLAGLLLPGMRVDVMFTVGAAALLGAEKELTSGAPENMDDMKEAIVSASSAAVQADDKVTVLLFQNALVLAIDAVRGADLHRSVQDSEGEGQKRTYNTVTVMLTRKQARILVFCLNQGQLTLALRKSGDTTFEKAPQPVNFDVVHDYLTEGEVETQQ